MSGRNFKSNSNLFFKRLEKKNQPPQESSTEKSATPQTEAQKPKELPKTTVSLNQPHSFPKKLSEPEKPSFPKKNEQPLTFKESSFFEKPKNLSLLSTILINPCQKGNPLINNLRNCAWAWADIDEKNGNAVPDYQVGRGAGALFLSLKYHKLYPEYVYQRLTALGAISKGSDSSQAGYRSLFLLICVDVPDHHESLKELQCLSITSTVTIFLCWNYEEAARYIEAFKKMENKSPDSLKERESMVDDEGGQRAKFGSVLNKIRTINKTDVSTIVDNFPNFKTLAQVSTEQLSLCPGLGEKKVVQLKKALNQPFLEK